MTPDTIAYMIAGFSVILGGIVIYIISLIMRISRMKRQLDMLQRTNQD